MQSTKDWTVYKPMLRALQLKKKCLEKLQKEGIIGRKETRLKKQERKEKKLSISDVSEHCTCSYAQRKNTQRRNDWQKVRGGAGEGEEKDQRNEKERKEKKLSTKARVKEATTTTTKEKERQKEKKKEKGKEKQKD